MEGTRLVDGIYASSVFPYAVVEVKGTIGYFKYLAQFDHPDLELEHGMKIAYTYGQFSDTSPEVEEKTGAKKYNLEGIVAGFKQQMVTFPDGKGYWNFGLDGQLGQAHLLTDEELQKVLDAREPLDNPSSPYPIQPQNQGKLIWLSGAPGCGKSTTAQIMAKTEGYVYYEADCFMNFINPYIGLDVENPSLDVKRQKPLKGYSKETILAASRGLEIFQGMSQGKSPNTPEAKRFFNEMAKNVKFEKERLGGNFVVAQAVPTRELRDCIKDILGPEAIFVTLTLSEDTRMQRVEARHSGGDESMKKSMMDFLQKIHAQYECAQSDESNAVDVLITSDMSREDVMRNILKATSVQDFKRVSKVSSLIDFYSKVGV